MEGDVPTGMIRASVPYIDQPAPFWRDVLARFGDRIEEVYFPLPRTVFGSGRPLLPAARLEEFLDLEDLPRTVLLNAPALDGAYGETRDRLAAWLEGVRRRCRLKGAVVRDIRLLRDLGPCFPDLEWCASTLMEIAGPADLAPVRGLVRAMTPASWLVRDRPALTLLRRSYTGRIKLLVNEGCLARCPWRTEHFRQMNSGMAAPPVLCAETLATEPWRCLTGAWILPQHLELLAGLFDVVKIDGRATLGDPDRWLEVVGAYVDGGELPLDRIGSGPAAPGLGWSITREFFERTLVCDKLCAACRICKDYYEHVAHP